MDQKSFVKKACFQEFQHLNQDISHISSNFCSDRKVEQFLAEKKAISRNVSLLKLFSQNQSSYRTQDQRHDEDPKKNFLKRLIEQSKLR